jgi:1-aminocyclopropane-1-carboxylate deaminase/D-cysteine desulfhydrase-like pyridoxal-dependent ACC family enzyme
MLLSRFPRVSLAHLPTPLEALPRLGKHLGPDIRCGRIAPVSYRRQQNEN